MMPTKIGNDIWNNPLRLGKRRRCVGCNGLVLRERKRPNTVLPKYCTDNCRKRHHRKFQYLKNREKELLVNKEYRILNKEYWDQKNKDYYAKRKEKINFTHNYIATLKV